MPDVTARIDTASILNNCALHAKIARSKIQAYYLNVSRADVQMLGLQDGDRIDIAILKVNHPQSNSGLPGPVNDSLLGKEQQPVEELGQLPQELPQKTLVQNPQGSKSPKRITRKGDRGKSRRGKEGKLRSSHSKGKRSKRANA